MTVWVEAAWKTAATIAGIAAFVGLITLAEKYQIVATVLLVLCGGAVVGLMYVSFLSGAVRRRERDGDEV